MAPRNGRLAARLLCLAGLAAAVALALAHFSEIRFGRFLFLFIAIDAIGFAPGALAQRRAGGGPIPRIYHALYDATHSLVANAALAAAWSIAVGPEWALLAAPIHLLGDRALFGNFSAPFGPPTRCSRPQNLAPIEALAQERVNRGDAEDAETSQRRGAKGQDHVVLMKHHASSDTTVTRSSAGKTGER